MLEPPEPRPQRHLPRGLALARADVQPDHLRFADLARLDHLFREHVGRVEDEVLVDAEHDLRCRGGRDHPVSLGHGERHRLLHRDVLARLARRDRHRRVQMVGHQQLHQVDFGIVQQAAVVRVDLAHAPGCGLRLGQGLPGVADGHKAGILTAAIAHLVQIGDPAAADDRDAKGGMVDLRVIA